MTPFRIAIAPLPVLLLAALLLLPCPATPADGVPATLRAAHDLYVGAHGRLIESAGKGADAATLERLAAELSEAKAAYEALAGPAGPAVLASSPASRGDLAAPEPARRAADPATASTAQTSAAARIAPSASVDLPALRAQVEARLAGSPAPDDRARLTLVKAELAGLIDGDWAGTLALIESARALSAAPDIAGRAATLESLAKSAAAGAPKVARVAALGEDARRLAAEAKAQSWTNPVAKIWKGGRSLVSLGRFQLSKLWTRKAVKGAALYAAAAPVTAPWFALAAGDPALPEPTPGADAAALYRPIGEWTGRLILPKASERTPDGSVLVELENAPDPSLVGATVRLRFDLSAPDADWYESVRSDIAFDPAKLEKVRKAGRAVPERLNGWANVSPLESLAGARAADDVRVLLAGARRSADGLVVDREPVQISGARVALVRFVGPAAGDLRTVAHWNRSTRAFDGPIERIRIPAEIYDREPGAPRGTTLGIESVPFNVEGFYIYGRRDGGTFAVEALEPRAALALPPTATAVGRDAADEAIREGFWGNLSSGLFRALRFEPSARAAADPFPVGSSHLVSHLFGGRTYLRTGVCDGLNLGCVTGHFSFGVARVAECPFTGDPRFDVTYKQVYAHTMAGIVSGSLKWHEYMGNLARGWMYAIPVGDTIVRIPELDPYDIDGEIYDPIRGFERELERVMAVYRTGAGSGISSVGLAMSCVQDSHCGLYLAIAKFKSRSGPRLEAWIARGGDEPARVRRLFSLCDEALSRFTLFGVTRGDWKAASENLLVTRDQSVFEQALHAIQSVRTMFPRRGNDNLLHLAAARGYPMHGVLTCFAGGLQPDLLPVAPTSPTIRQKE